MLRCTKDYDCNLRNVNLDIRFKIADPNIGTCFDMAQKDALQTKLRCLIFKKSNICDNNLNSVKNKKIVSINLTENKVSLMLFKNINSIFSIVLRISSLPCVFY